MTEIQPINIPLILAELEETITTNIYPYFLIITYEEQPPETIHIVLSHPDYEMVAVADRIKPIYNLINEKNSDIIDKIPIIVEAFSPNEIGDLIEYIV